MTGTGVERLPQQRHAVVATDTDGKKPKNKGISVTLDDSVAHT